MCTYYVYRLTDRVVVAIIEGESNDACETKAAEVFGDDFGATYSPAFGAESGLIDNPDAEYVSA